MSEPVATAAAAHALPFGPFVLDEANARLTRDGVPIELPPKDFDVLCFLARHRGHLVTKEELLDAVWQHRFVSESVLKSVISRLRAALGDSAQQPRYIETAPRRGYRFVTEGGRPPPLPAEHSLEAARGAHADASRLVARADQLAWLGQRLDAAAGGTSAVVLLSGEAGIGKSSLLEAFALSADSVARADVALGQCIEHAGAVEPYLPFLEALNTWCRGSRGDAVVLALRQVAPTWLVQLPWLVTSEDRRQLQQEVAGSTQDRMLREFGELLDHCTASRPLLLLIEDLHWSDHASIQLIGYLARRRGRARLLLLGSFRPADVIVSAHPLNALRTELRQHRQCEQLDLELFSQTDTAEYLRRRFAGSSWPDAAVRELHHHTGGLPLFMAAVVDEIAATAPDADPVLAVLGLRDVPRSIFGLIERQHARLADPLQRWLQAASVYGVEFVHAPLADALRANADELQAAFDTLCRAGSWLRALPPVALPDGRVGVRYAFTHAVHRKVLYELAGDAARMQVHRRIAAALVHVYADDVEDVAGEVAVHFEQGRDTAQAVQYLAVAARAALARFAAQEAAAIAQRALSLLSSLKPGAETQDAEIGLRVTVGVAQGQLHGITSSESRREYKRAVALIDENRSSPVVVPAMHGIWLAALVHGDMARARAMAERTLALTERRPDELLRFAGHAAMGMTLVHIGDMPLARQQLLEALQHHQRLEPVLPRTMFSMEPGVQLAAYLAMCLRSGGEPSDAARRMRWALERAEQLRHPMTQALALQFESTLQCMDSRFDLAAATAERALQLTDQHGLALVSGTQVWIKGRCLAAAGEVEQGLATMLRGKALLERHGLICGLTRWHQFHAEACFDDGRYDAADEAIEQGLALARRTGEQRSSAELRLLRGRLLALRNSHDGARQEFAQALDLARSQGQLPVEIAAAAAMANARRCPASIETLASSLARWTDPLAPIGVIEARALLTEMSPGGPASSLPRSAEI